MGVSMGFRCTLLCPLRGGMAFQKSVTGCNKGLTGDVPKPNEGRLGERLTAGHVCACNGQWCGAVCEGGAATPNEAPLWTGQ